jgi:hypothetical protein
LGRRERIGAHPNIIFEHHHVYLTLRGLAALVQFYSRDNRFLSVHAMGMFTSGI